MDLKSNGPLAGPSANIASQNESIRARVHSYASISLLLSFVVYLRGTRFMNLINCVHLSSNVGRVILTTLRTFSNPDRPAQQPTSVRQHVRCFVRLQQSYHTIAHVSSTIERLETCCPILRLPGLLTVHSSLSAYIINTAPITAIAPAPKPAA